ncbi:DUF1287 domain-containing protein [Exilibacterium tricleocarpae]|uniref:DUF1287 domain-containing protein n=1 Tax=Exilibacterium tricleocarpae TaxID=2591008 RepID=A0A545TZL9_9GAMM|nr:DUF1287 domain-containing protein [Exilibacterium tricleocarpae]TQV82655.1 DUF1287 domain-containing protein [Exilibacterium tricleocarpae]
MPRKLCHSDAFGGINSGCYRSDRLREVTLRNVLFALVLISHGAWPASFARDLVAAAHERTKHRVEYNGAYFAISYPNGDVPRHIGVCTDVVIRAYRALGTDLQQLVHEDIAANFDSYPSRRIWNLDKPDKNIDHRRVPNLRRFFSRHGSELPVSDRGDAYKPGDLVTWMLPGNLPHIGIVTDEVDRHTGTPLIVHNIGRGPQLENMLFKYKITGRYRYVPANYRGGQ